MKSPKIVLALAAAAALGAVAPATGNVASQDPFPAPDEPLAIFVQGDGAQTLYQLLRQLGSATGLNFTVSQQTRASLEGTSPGLLEDLVVPPSEAVSFVGSLLHRHGFSMSELRDEAPRLIAIHGGQDRPSSWKRIDASELEVYRDHPALLIETVVVFEHVDVRQLTTSLRGLATDNQYQVMLNAGNTNSVILRGPVASVVDIIAMMSAANDAAGEAWAARAAQEAQSQEQQDQDG